MKKTPSKKITSILLSLALMLTMVALPSMAMPVQAAEIEAATPTTFVADRTGTTNTIMFGENNLFSTTGLDGDGTPIKWRVMAVDTDSNGDTILTLMADTPLGYRRYDPTGHQLWSGSDICTYLNGTGTYAGAGFLQSSFSSEEQRAMAPQYSTVEESGYIPTDKYTPNQTIVLPSYEEVRNLGTWDFTSDALRTTNPRYPWWLRSAGNFNYNVAFVSNSGNVDSNGDVMELSGVLPAFKINLASVIFASSNPGGKPTSVGANLSAATPPTGAQKLTVIDTNTSNLNLTIADDTARTAVQGETLAVDYTDAVVGTNKYVSCVIEQGGVVKYYAKLTNTANGTASIELPANMPTGSYKIKMFNEQCNADNYTDFASDPIEIDLTLNSVPTAPQNFAANPANQQVSLSWAAPLDSGNNLIAGYEVQKDSDSWIAVAKHTNYTFTGLTNGQSYNFKVRAVNNAGYGAEAAVSATPIAAVIPTINGTTNGTTSHTVTLGYSDPVDIDLALGGIPTPTLVLNSHGGTGGTLTGNRLTIPTGLALGRYFITLTADNLTAIKATHTVTFIVSDGSTPPPISTGGRSSGSGSGGGSTKRDSAPTAGASTGATVIGKPLTKADATKLFNTALAANPEGQATLSFKARNYTSVDKAVLAELAALAQKNGVTLTVHFDSVKDGTVTSRISVNPAAVTTSLDLTVKLVGNKITLPKFAVPVELAVTMPAGMTIENLKITQNGVDITASAKPWLDKNGYLHFTTTGGEIVLSVK